MALLCSVIAFFKFVKHTAGKLDNPWLGCRVFCVRLMLRPGFLIPKLLDAMAGAARRRCPIPQSSRGLDNRDWEQNQILILNDWGAITKVKPPIIAFYNPLVSFCGFPTISGVMSSNSVILLKNYAAAFLFLRRAS